MPPSPQHPSSSQDPATSKRSASSQHSAFSQHASFSRHSASSHHPASTPSRPPSGTDAVQISLPPDRPSSGADSAHAASPLKQSPSGADPAHSELPQTRPLSSAEWVRADLERKLDDGTFAPGTKLPSVDELSRQYGVGRSTVREAISALKAMGRLAVRQGGGTFALAAPDPAASAGAPQHPAALMPERWPDRAASLRSVLEVRRVLETGCAALAAENRTPEDIAALEALLAEMERNVTGREASERLDVRFHLAVADAAHNETLSEMMRSISERLHDSMQDSRALWLFAERTSADRLLAEHRSIFEAVRDGDAPLARSRMEEHLAKVAGVLHARA